MSEYWNITCGQCRSGWLSLEAFEGRESADMLLREQKTLEAIAEPRLDARLRLNLCFRGYYLDLPWIRSHAGHPWVAKDEYGNILFLTKPCSTMSETCSGTAPATCRDHGNQTHRSP